MTDAEITKASILRAMRLLFPVVLCFGVAIISVTLRDSGIITNESLLEKVLITLIVLSALRNAWETMRFMRRSNCIVEKHGKVKSPVWEIVVFTILSAVATTVLCGFAILLSSVPSLQVFLVFVAIVFFLLALSPLYYNHVFVEYGNSSKN